MKNKPSLKKLPLVVAIGMASTAAWAQEQSVATGTTEVWATQVSSTSAFLGGDDIELKQADHLSDLMRSLPGVEIGGSHSMVQKINIRALDDTNLNITIDGASQNGYMYHHAGNLLINPDILKAANIQVGANSVLTGALGGAVEFETKDAADLLQAGQRFGARIQGNVASNKYFGYSLTGYGQVSDSVDILAYIYQVDRDNPEDGKGRESLGNDGDIVNGMLKAGLDLNDENRIELGYDRYKDDGDYPFRADMGVATNKAITGDRLYPTTYDRSTLTAVYELDKGDDLYLKANAYRNELELEREENTDDYRVKAGSVENTGAKILAESLIESGNVTHTLRYGGEINKEKSRVHKDGVDHGGEDATNAALYIENEIAFGNARLIPGIRQNHYDLNTSMADKTYDETTWSLAGELDVTDSFTLRAATTSLFQGPNLEEAFYADTVNPANPALKPETGLNSELGFRFDQQNVGALDKLATALTLFHTRIDDRIEYGRGTGWYNQDEVTLKGFEASVKMDKGDLGVLLTYARTNSDVKETGEPVSDESGDTISMTVDYALPAHNLELEWESQVVRDEDKLDKKGYDVHSISVRWSPAAAEGLVLTAGIENLFDEYYVSHVSRIGESNHPRFGQLLLDDSEPGRNFKLTAAYSF